MDLMEFYQVDVYICFLGRMNTHKHDNIHYVYTCYYLNYKG